ncbi:aldehyde dehydrogenase family protein [Bordetella sp. BOR01]|nr:aldehyde dehydrogenase family protein [Bordetella sp. BOR01]
MESTKVQGTLPRGISPRLDMLIDGKSVTATTGKLRAVENPANGQVITQVAEGGADDVDLAVRAARASFDKGSWRKASAVHREKTLWRLAELLEENIDELATLEVMDNGMPASMARRAIERALDGLRYYAGMCTKVHGVTSDISGLRAEFHAYSLCEPIGVAALIVPWNSPLPAACNKIGPALAAGCSCVLKPAEQTPLTALRLGQLALEAGIPPGVLNVVTGEGAVVGAALADHPDVDKISFTGSTEVGKGLLHAAAGNMKRLTLELGGKSPVFIFDDADLKIAIPRAAAAIFSNSGQICYAGSRLFVQQGVYEEVLAGIAGVASNMRIGDGFDADTELGPLISEHQRDRVMSYIDSARSEGAELVAGGQRLDRNGYFVQPTVFSGTRVDMRFMREEIFGPVLGAMPFAGIDDVETLANATRFGLGAGIFTRSVSTAHRVARLIRTGNVWVNFYGGSDKSLPFGGYKESGWGREGGIEGIEAFMEKKAVYIRL